MHFEIFINFSIFSNEIYMCDDGELFKAGWVMTTA